MKKNGKTHELKESPKKEAKEKSRGYPVQSRKQRRTMSK